MMKKSDFLHVGTVHRNQRLIEKYSGGHGQEWLWPLRSQGSKISCISRSSLWNNWFLVC